jgi:superfamily I DNA and RNA helicase
LPDWPGLNCVATLPLCSFRNGRPFAKGITSSCGNTRAIVSSSKREKEYKNPRNTAAAGARPGAYNAWICRVRSNGETVLSQLAKPHPAEELPLFTGNESRVDEELNWLAKSIAKDIKEHDVSPEQILVISLDARHAKGYMMALQAKLFSVKILSTIPGFIDDSSAFAEPDKVTLATVYRSKGNEAPIVYILSMESLYDFAEELENRNRAFTAISRSKGWVRISGVGRQMQRVANEIEMVLTDLPRLKFVFPDMEKIRRLDATETSRRRKSVRTAKEAATQLAKIDPEALAELDPKARKELLKRLKEASDEDQ